MERVFMIVTTPVSEDEETETINQAIQTKGYAGEKKHKAIDDLACAMSSVLLQLGVTPEDYEKIVTQTLPRILMDELKASRKELPMPSDEASNG